MSDLRLGPVRLSQAPQTLAKEGLDARDQRHLERFLDLPSLQQSHVPAGLSPPGLASLAATFAEPMLDNPQILRSQNFSRLLSSVDEQLASVATDDPVIKLTRLVLNQELKKHELLREQLGALVER